MGYLVHVLLGLAPIVLSELGDGAGFRAPGMVPLLAAVPYAVGFAARRLLLAGRMRSASLLERAVRHAGPALMACAVFVLGWCSSVAEWFGARPGAAGWPGPELLAALAPFVLYEIAAIDAHARLVDSRPRAIAAQRGLQVRLFLSALLPFASFAALSVAVGFDETLRVHLEEVSLLSAGFTAAFLVGLLVFMPALLRRTWDTVPLEAGRLRRDLEAVARAAGFRCRDLVVWRTGNQMANAAIVGLTPGSRVVLFTDVLLARLSPRETAAVFAHEIGHALGRHPLVFASFALSFFLAGDLAMGWLGLDGALGSGLFLVGLLAAWYLSFGWLSRRFELEADLTSLDVMGESAPLIEALREVGGTHGRERRSWRHFGTEDRVEFLVRAEADPRLGERLRRNLRRWRRAGVVLAAVLLAWQLVSLAGGLREERLVALLRLGRFEEAGTHVDAAADPRVAALVERAAGVPGSERSPAALEGRALRAARGGRVAEAADWVELAVLRGGAELRPLLDWLDGREAGTGRAPPPEVDGEWRAILRELEASAPAGGDGER